MKDRIRQIMESQHMNQQSFAAFIGIAPASLSSMLQERTRPTLNTVEAILNKLPNINLSWLINGEGEMYRDQISTATTNPDEFTATSSIIEPTLDFDAPEPPKLSAHQKERNIANVDVKNIDNTKRRITEIRVFFDDQTWESFVPKK